MEKIKLRTQKLFIDTVKEYIKNNKQLYNTEFIEHVIETNKTTLDVLNEKWKNKIESYFSKISGSDWEARQKLKEFVEISSQ